MRPAKYMVLYILCCSFFAGAYAQHTNVPAAVRNIFDDLPIDDPATNSILKPGEDSIQKIKKNIFITAAASSQHCYLGQPILLTYTLYSALQTTSTIDRAPSYAGFSVAAMEADNEHVKRKKQDGKNYRVFTVQQVQLTPLQEGLLIIDAISVYSQVSYKENGATFHYGGRTGSKPITINVEPLPVAGRPAGFSGASGNFTLLATADTLLAAGENNTLHIEVAGSGNFTAVSMPAINWPEGCDHFSVTSHLQINKNSFPSSGTKIFDIPFVPSKEGLLVIPALQLSFFDTQKKIYQLVYSTPISIHVSAALAKPGNPGPAVPVKKQVPFYYWLLLVTVLALTGMAVYRRKMKLAVGAGEKPAVLPVIIPVEPLVQENSIDKASLEALGKIDNTTDYITAFKNILTAFLQRQTGNSTGTEEALLQEIQLKDAALAAQAGDLYAQCNSFLYAPGTMDTVVRATLEHELASIAEKTSQHVA